MNDNTSHRRLAALSQREAQHLLRDEACRLAQPWLPHPPGDAKLSALLESFAFRLLDGLAHDLEAIWRARRRHPFIQVYAFQGLQERSLMLGLAEDDRVVFVELRRLAEQLLARPLGTLHEGVGPLLQRLARELGPAPEDTLPLERLLLSAATPALRRFWRQQVASELHDERVLHLPRPTPVVEA